MALTAQEEQRVRQLLQGVRRQDLDSDLRSAVAEGQAAHDDNITSGSIAGNSVTINNREGNRSVRLSGDLPSIPSDTITEEQLTRAIDAIMNRLLPLGGSVDDILTKAAGDAFIFKSFANTLSGSERFGPNHLANPIPANTTGLHSVTPQFDLTDNVLYALQFASVGSEAVLPLLFALGDNRPKAGNGGAYVLTTNGISITDGFDGALIGIHRIVARGERGPAGADGNTVRISGNLLRGAVQANGSSRTVIVPPDFVNPLGVFIGTLTAAHSYNDHPVLAPFRSGDQNVYRRDGLGFSIPDDHTVRADSGFGANDRIISWRYFK